MFLVKRTKSAPLPDGTPGPERVHWLAACSPEGHALGWTPDRATAKALGEWEASQVVGYHAGRENAGKVEAVPALALATDQELKVVGVRGLRHGPTEDDLRKAVAEVERRGREIDARDRQLAELKSLAASLEADAARWQRRAEAAERELETLTAPTPAGQAAPEAPAAPTEKRNGKPKGKRPAPVTESETIPTTTEAELATTDG